jgi:hypothetical protein
VASAAADSSVVAAGALESADSAESPELHAPRETAMAAAAVQARSFFFTFGIPLISV